MAACKPVLGLAGWASIHRWSSLACTVFLLVICVTGLPLVVQADIERWLATGHLMPASGSVSLEDIDNVMDAALRKHPGYIITSLSVDEDASLATLSIAPSPAATNPAPAKAVRFDTHTAMELGMPDPSPLSVSSFMNVLFRLHTDLFAGLPGALFLGAMGVLFVIATVSGVVLYGPYMKRLSFGTVRTGRSLRIRWLDLHNLLGIVTLMWVLVVGVTGVINELAQPMFSLWERTDMQRAIAPWHDRPPLPAAERITLPDAVHAACGARPHSIVMLAVSPGDEGASAWHYAVWVHDVDALTSWRYHLILVDARAGTVAVDVHMPWYMQVLAMSRPLHFGDTGGFPLKAIWMALDAITIVIISSGLYLWWSRYSASLRARKGGGRTAGPAYRRGKHPEQE